MDGAVVAAGAEAGMGGYATPLFEVAEWEFTDAAGLRWRRHGTAQPTWVLLDPAPDLS